LVVLCGEPAFLFSSKFAFFSPIHFGSQAVHAFVKIEWVTFMFLLARCFLSQRLSVHSPSVSAGCSFPCFDYNFFPPELFFLNRLFEEVCRTLLTLNLTPAERCPQGPFRSALTFPTQPGSLFPVILSRGSLALEFKYCAPQLWDGSPRADPLPPPPLDSCARIFEKLFGQFMRPQALRCTDKICGDNPVDSLFPSLSSSNVSEKEVAVSLVNCFSLPLSSPGLVIG